MVSPVPALSLVIVLILSPMASQANEGGPSGSAAPEKTAHITYLSGNTVFVDAGRTQGLVVGQELDVVRDAQVVAVIRVQNLASERASCTVTSEVELRVGDTVQFHPMNSAPDPAPAPNPLPRQTAKKRTDHWFRAQGVRGRFGVQYLTVKDMGESGQEFTQPVLGVNMTGDDIGGSGMDAVVDLRARRTYRSIGEDDGRTRVYRLNVSRGFLEDKIRLSLGRQSSPNLSSVSIFDGLLIELAPSRFTLGLFTGTQPDPISYAYSREVFEFGAYGMLQGRSSGTGRWSATTGFVNSSVHGIPNRDYVFLRGRYSSRRLFAYLSQEVDLNSEWKLDAGESMVSPTSTVLNVTHKVTERLSLRAGFDNRRRVRLYRDRTTPEEDFNDDYRTGWSLGSDLELGRRIKVGAQGRFSSGSSAGSSDAYTGSFLARIGKVVQTAGSRFTFYTTPASKGRMYSMSVGGGPSPRQHLQIHAGIRDEDRYLDEGTRIISRWIGFDADVGLTRSLYLLLSMDLIRGDVENNNQTFSGLSYRF